MSNYIFEICANSAESVAQAKLGGAQRVELCAGIPEGGTTPSYGEIKAALRYPGGSPTMNCCPFLKTTEVKHWNI